MAFADFADYKNALETRSKQATLISNTPSTAIPVGTLVDFSSVMVPAPAIPTTSVAFNKSSDRALNQFIENGGVNPLMLTGARPMTAGAQLSIMVVDLLCMSGGLSGIVTGPQTTNLPTAALPRYTDGEGVQAALINHATIGSGGTTFTVEYTNQAGTGSRASTAMPIGGGLRHVPLLTRIPVQGSDSGFRSVESVTLAATTNVAGNIGVVLYRPLAMIFYDGASHSANFDSISSGGMVPNMAEALDDACIAIFGVVSTPQALYATLNFAEA